MSVPGAGLSAKSAAPEARQLQPIDDPAVLTYRFEEVWAWRGMTPTQLHPVDLDLDGMYESYHVQSARDPNESISHLLFYPCVCNDGTVRSFNFNTRRITDTRVVELGNGDVKSIAITYTRADTAWLEIIDPSRGSVYRKAMAAGHDLDGNGHWDGECLIAGEHDFNGDGRAELLIRSFTGYDRSPRQLSCLDLHHDSVLWNYPVAGDISGDYLSIIDSVFGDLPAVVFGVGSVNNGVAHEDMADSISFLICLDGAGQLRWKRATGGKSTTGGRPTLIGAGRGRNARLAFVEVDGDRSFRPGPGALDSLRERILVCDLAGTIHDSLEIPPGIRVSELKSIWHSGRGEHVVWLGLGGNTLQVRDEALGLLSELQYDSRIAPLALQDFLSTGTPQYLVATMDGRLWLLTDQFEPLAVLLGVQSPVLRGILAPESPGGSTRIVLEADVSRSNIVLHLRKAPWHAIFTRHPILAFAAAFIPLSAIIGLIWTVMLRFRQKNRLIERQRDELARAMHDLRDAQDKLIEAEKLALTNDIAGGVAHEIRNALDPAVHCLHALSERLTTAAEPADTMRLVDLSAKSVRRAVSMTRLIREFADLAKTGPREPVDAANLFAEIVARHAERAEAIGAKIDLDLPAGLVFNGPATHADILFNNLIVNALDAVAGSAERRIVVRGTDSGSTARITVADTGPGIPAADRTRVFHAFYSTKLSTGMGLGLTFSKRIAEILGGSLALGPKSERGAEFIVELPTT